MTPAGTHSQGPETPRDLSVAPDVGGVDAVDTSYVSRRSFLRRAGVGAATAFVLADAAVAYRAHDQCVLAEERGPAFDAWDTWRNGTYAVSMVSAAVLAGSAHNTQPWRFAVSEDRIDLYVDLTRSAGANHALGAGSVVDSSLYRAIGSRHSNRSEYRSDPVPTSTLAAMDDLVDESVAPGPAGVAHRGRRAAGVRGPSGGGDPRAARRRGCLRSARTAGRHGRSPRASPSCPSGRRAAPRARPA